jgi:hypothetical protein
MLLQTTGGGTNSSPMRETTPAANRQSSQNQKQTDMPRLSSGVKKRLAIAFTVAAISDFFSAGLEFLPPLQWAVDALTAGLLFLVLGRQWLLLPGLIAEAIPGLAVVPFWVLVVASIAVWGTIKSQQHGVDAQDFSI